MGKGKERPVVKPNETGLKSCVLNENACTLSFLEVTFLTFYGLYITLTVICSEKTSILMFMKMIQ